MFDYFVAAALIAEISPKLIGGRIQDIVEIDREALGFEIYHQQERHYLYFNISAGQARAHLSSGKLRRGADSASPLGLLLRRYIEGARIIGISQAPWERILRFEIGSSAGEFTLIFEPIDRFSNLILVQDGIIQEALQRFRPKNPQARHVLPNQPYAALPLPNRLAPDSLNQTDFERLLSAHPDSPISQVLTQNIHGLSPLLVKEIIWRATGKDQAKMPAQDFNAAALFAAFQEIVQPLLAGEWQAGYAQKADSTSVYSVYPLTHLGAWQPAESLSLAIEACHPISGDAAYEAGKVPIYSQISRAEKQLRGKLFSLKQQQNDPDKLEFFRQAGELILAYQGEIETGQTSFSAQYEVEGEPLNIPLDPTLSPLENAQRYFERYGKAKRGQAVLPQLILDTERELRYLDQLSTDLDLAANWDEIGEVQDALQSAGYWRGQKYKRKTGSGKSGPLKVVADDGTIIWVGRNSRQNEETTFKRGAPEDLWLHVRGMPGAHVVIKTNGREVDPLVIEQAASLAAYFSKARHAGSAEVLVTERKHIRKVNGGKPGMVRVLKQSYPSVKAQPRAPENEAH